MCNGPSDGSEETSVCAFLCLRAEKERRSRSLIGVTEYIVLFMLFLF